MDRNSLLWHLSVTEGGIGGASDPHVGANKSDTILKAAYRLKELIDSKAFNESNMELTRDESEILFKQGKFLCIIQETGSLVR